MPFYYTLDYLKGEYALVFINTHFIPPVISRLIPVFFNLIPQ